MEIPDASMRPHFAASVSAGFTATISDPESAPELRALGADLPEYDFTISVSGDSMTPLIDDGDTLACRIETDRANPPVGKICVIDRAGGPVVKIIRSAREGNLILHSLNPAHPDFAVPVSEVLSISRVVGLIRTM
ncbi:MAG: S24 family peptidase [Bacteroides sp.]|nr:S24 family peptidase [Bacteroides sp.]